METVTEHIYKFLPEKPIAYAQVRGSEKYSDIYGNVMFYGVNEGSLVVADIKGLPYPEQKYNYNIFGFHIHEGNSCTGNINDSFADAKQHFNPHYVQHPNHAGDMPVLFGNKGAAWMAFYTNRFTPEEIIGRTVIIHDMPDDYKTQPSGNSGEKIACGVIKRI